MFTFALLQALTHIPEDAVIVTPRVEADLARVEMRSISAVERGVKIHTAIERDLLYGNLEQDQRDLNETLAKLVSEAKPTKQNRAQRRKNGVR